MDRYHIDVAAKQWMLQPAAIAVVIEQRDLKYGRRRRRRDGDDSLRNVSMDFQATWECLRSMQRHFGLVMSPRHDVPVRDEEGVAVILAEEPGSVTQRNLGVLRKDLQFCDAKRMLVGVDHF